MVFTILFPAVLAFCHCCGPSEFLHSDVLSSPGMQCCDMVKTFFHETTTLVEKNMAFFAAFFALLFIIFTAFKTAPVRVVLPVRVRSGPPLFVQRASNPRYLSLKVFRI